MSIKYSEIQKNMKGVRLPPRSELYAEPWDAEQLRFFCERQKNVARILERKGIKIK